MFFWESDVENSLDRMFDYNRDGKLDPVERGLEFTYLDSLSNPSSSSSRDRYSSFRDEDDEDADDYGFDSFDSDGGYDDF